jgi:TatD DNase family protein
MIQAFEKIIALAEKLKIPMIVHSRKAEEEVIDILETSKHKKIIMHFFCGRKHLVKKIQDNGWSFSIPTNIVRLTQLQQIVETTPLDKIFTETDCPWLSPFLVQTNEPAFVAETIKKIVQIKKMEEEEVIKNIYMNYQKMFL